MKMRKKISSRKGTMGTWEALGTVNRFLFRKEGGWYLAYIALSVLLTAETFVNLYFTEYTANSAYGLISNEIRFSDAAIVILWLSLALLAFWALRIVGNMIWEKLHLKTRYHFEKELLEQASHIEYDYYESHDNNLDIYEACSKSLEAYENFMQSTVFYITIIPIAAVYIWYMAQINIVVVLVYLLLVAALNLLSGRLFGQLGDMWQEIQPSAQRQKYFFSVGSEKNSHQECRLCRLYPFVAGKWNKAYDEEYKIRIKIFGRYEVGMQAVRFISNIPYILMLAFVAYETVMGRHEIGFFVMVNGLLNNILNSVESLQANMAQNQQDKVFIEKYRKVMSMRREKRVDGDVCTSELTLTDVKYRYPQASTYALEGVTFRIAEGEKIALVGVNGSGKTTCMMLILGLLRLQGEESLFGGGELGRRHISCILQDFAQYQMSIRENIRAGCVEREMTDDDIYGLLREVGMEEFVRKQEKGLDTMLGQLEEGTDLSKGQWQRIAIARLLANPDSRLWILDEPTAYLDPMSEIEIYRLIQKLSGNRMVIFISHRLGFARNADRIIVFDKGRVALSGKHEELIKVGGIYAEMYESQRQWYL